MENAYNIQSKEYLNNGDLTEQDKINSVAMSIKLKIRSYNAIQENYTPLDFELYNKFLGLNMIEGNIFTKIGDQIKQILYGNNIKLIIENKNEKIYLYGIYLMY